MTYWLRYRPLIHKPPPTPLNAGIFVSTSLHQQPIDQCSFLNDDVIEYCTNAHVLIDLIRRAACSMKYKHPESTNQSYS